MRNILITTPKKWSFFVLLLIASFSSVAQYQPLGIAIGEYAIKAGEESLLKSFCMDLGSHTPELGMSYGRVALGGSKAFVKVGQVKYPIEEAIQKKLISFEAIDGYRNVKVHNLTHEDIQFIIDDDFVLTRDNDSRQVTHARGLNEGGKQPDIWGYNEIEKARAKYQKYGLINGNERFTLDDVSKRSKEFLKKNGAEEDLYDATSLMDEKEQILDVNSAGEKILKIRIGTKNGMPNYYLDNGRSLPVFEGSDERSLYASIKSHFNNEEHAYLQVEGPSAVKEDAVINNLNRFARAEGSVKRFGRFEYPLRDAGIWLDKGPSLVKVSSIKSFDGLNEATLDVVSGGEEAALTLGSGKKTYLSRFIEKVRSYFGADKKATKSLMQIMNETDADMKRVFPNYSPKDVYKEMDVRVALELKKQSETADQNAAR
jgi:hypothetical protein